MQTDQEITVIIVDDDVMSIKKLSDDLEAFPDVRVVATSCAPAKAQKIIVSEQPDMLFLDVEMPGMSGIELLKRLQPELHPEVKAVFYTAYNKYVLEALRASAFDYLLKPYMPEELEAIMERCRSYAPQSAETLEQSLHKLLVQSNVFAMQTQTGLMLVSCEKILMFEYSNDRCWQMMLTDENKLHKLRKNVSAKELLSLSNSFAMISQDCIVNLNYLAHIENKTLQCTFYPPHEHLKRTVSQRHFKKMRERLDII